MSDFLNSLQKLSSAEEFFSALKVDYDPPVVKVNRLHILKRFNDYLAAAGLPGDKDDATLSVLYAEHLTKAYNDFVKSDAVTEKVFKVFKQAAGEAFVPLTSIERSL